MLRDAAIREYQVHNALNDILTIPSCSKICPDYHKNYQQMGLAGAGILLEEILPYSIMEEKIKSPLFASPYFMELVPGATNIFRYQRRLPGSFFDAIELTMEIAHDRGIILPVDLESNVLVCSQGNPHIVDFDFSFWLGYVEKEEFESGKNQNKEAIMSMREKYQQ